MEADLPFFAEDVASQAAAQNATALGTATGVKGGRVASKRATLRLSRWSRLLLSLPPFVVFGYLAYLGLFCSPLTALAWGVPLLAGAVGWARLVNRRES